MTAALDEEHGQIVASMNALYDAVDCGTSLSFQRLKMHALESFFRHNCLEEEMMMDRDGFIRSRFHKEEHRSLYIALHALETAILADNQGNVLKLLDKLRDALISHVRIEDQEVADWHRGCQVPGAAAY
jgi:hemerythrin-like metal-binding protein